MSHLAIYAGAAQQVQSRKDSKKARFDELAATEWKPLYRYAYWLTGNRSLAEDLVQDTLLRAWRFFDQLTDPAAARGWLLTILRRENARRFERKRMVAVDASIETVADHAPGYDTSTEAFVLRRALQTLPEEYREPLLMQVIYGYSQKEIAAQLGISCGGAGTRLFRARQKLREVLDPSA